MLSECASCILFFPVTWAAVRGTNSSKSCNFIAVNELKNHSLWKYTGSSGEKKNGEFSTPFANDEWISPTFTARQIAVRDEQGSPPSVVQLHQRGYHSWKMTAVFTASALMMLKMLSWACSNAYTTKKKTEKKKNKEQVVSSNICISVSFINCLKILIFKVW